MTRFRDFGVTPGSLPSGPLNALTDVAGVRVGHVTLISGEGPLVEGQGPVRTGATAILPHGGNLFRHKAVAAVDTINGFGKATGFEQIREMGWIETPILLTSTLNVGRVWDGVMSYMLRHNPDIALTTSTVCPVVAECHDGFLSDIRGRHVHEEHVLQAIESAKEGPVEEGNVGAGTGIACYQFKGGIGTSSRLVEEDSQTFTIGALAQTNFGSRPDLRMMGIPVGQLLKDEYLPHNPASIPRESLIIVLATDLPFDARALGRLARRAVHGIARTGSYSGNSSGDFVIAFSTANPVPHSPDERIDSARRAIDDGALINTCFRAVAEAVEEAIYNALVAAQTMTGRDGNTLYALPHERLAELLGEYRVRRTD